MLTQKQIDLINRRNVVVLATSDIKGKPRSTFVVVNKIENNQIIITDNEMGRMRDNLLVNNEVALLAFEADYSYCLKIARKAKYYTTGDYFDYVKLLDANKNQKPKGAIVITPEEIIEFK